MAGRKRAGIAASEERRPSEDSRTEGAPAPSAAAPPARLPGTRVKRGAPPDAAVSGQRRGGQAVVGSTEIVTVRLPGDLLERIERTVRNSGGLYRDRSEFIRQTLAVAVLPPQKVVVRQRKRFEVSVKEIIRLPEIEEPKDGVSEEKRIQNQQLYRSKKSK